MIETIDVSGKIPIVKECDVIVVGGGIAGCAAAVAAARRGVSVTLIEKSIVLGGLATLGHVCIYLPLDDGRGRKVYGGLAEELLHVCIKYGYDNLPDCWRSKPMFVENPEGRYKTNFNIPAAVMALDELMENEGVNVVFDTVFSEPIMENGRCLGIIVENKSGRTAYMAKAFVDASGDSDLLFRAGAECEDRENIISYWSQELTFESLKKGIEERSFISAAPIRSFGLKPHEDPSKSNLPMFKGTNSEDVNAYIRVSRSLAREYLKANQNGDRCMMTLPFMPDFRMTRRLIGKSELIVKAGRREEHSIGCMIDSLHPDGVYEFPYEGLINDTIANIAAAGRMVSATGRAWEIARFIPACALTGHAAGAVAAVSAISGFAMQNINVAELQRSLEYDGVILHMDND